MRLLTFPIAMSLALATSCAPSPPLRSGCESQNCGEHLVYFGTHGNVPGKEMFGAFFNEATGELRSLGSVADVFRPTWLAADPRRDILYSVSESGNDGKSQGHVLSFKVDRTSGKLTQISNAEAGGGGSTHLDYDPRSHSLFVANFGSGTVSVLPVDDEGHIGAVAAIERDYGTGPNRRQASPHAHGVTLDPTGRFILVPDLGADRTFIYRFNPATRQLTPAATPFAQVPPGVGPRHIIFGATGHFAYLATELTAQVIVYRWNPQTGSLSEAQTVELTPPDFAGQRSAAEIAVSSDGRFLYVSSREGESAVHVFAINPTNGTLEKIQRIETGTRPWSFSLSPSQNWMLVAEEGDSKVSVYRRDPNTGMLSATGKSIDVFQPVNVTFIR